MWRPRDREHFIGSYDPEREMPDPERDPGDRWQSDAYRRGARDTRFAYRWNPDRFEERFDGRRDVDSERDLYWRGDARDRDRMMGRGDMEYGRGTSYGRGMESGRGGYGGADRGYGGGYGGADRGYGGGYGRGYGGGYDRGGYGRSDYGRSDYSRSDYGRPDYGRGFGRDEYPMHGQFGSDRGWDRGGYYEGDMGGGGWDDDRDRGWRRR